MYVLSAKSFLGRTAWKEDSYIIWFSLTYAWAKRLKNTQSNQSMQSKAAVATRGVHEPNTENG